MSPRFSRPTTRNLTVLLALILGLIPLAAHAKVVTQGPTTLATGASEAEAPPLANQIGFFRSVLSRADGDRCGMYPSCSTYALESLHKHGALMGWIMASDRLLRCGHDEVRLAPAVRAKGRRLTYDLVSGNDFWWWTPPEAAPATGP